MATTAPDRTAELRATLDEVRAAIADAEARLEAAADRNAAPAAILRIESELDRIMFEAEICEGELATEVARVARARHRELANRAYLPWRVRRGANDE